MKLFKTDLGNYIELNYGEWMIDGVYYECSFHRKINVLDINSIKRVIKSQIVIGYLLDDAEYTVEQYNVNVLNILERAELAEYEDEGCIYQNYKFATTRDKFEYEYWKSATKKYKTEIAYEDVVDLEIVEEKFDTGNQFIKSLFSAGKTNEMNGIYFLNTYDACLYEMKNAFVKFDIIDYKLTEHSNIKYMKVKDEYLTHDKKIDYEYGNGIRGSLKDLEDRYEQIKEDSYNVVEQFYLSKYGKADLEVAIDIKNSVRRLNSYLIDISPKSKSIDAYNNARRIIDTIVSKCNRLLK